MKIKQWFLALALFSMILTGFSSSSEAINAVASFGRIQGDVHVIRKTRKIPGRKGLILNDKDTVVTGPLSKATIIFRDGSEIRLFHDTQFIIERSRESATGVRSFLNNFQLKVGSFWGKFTKTRQQTTIKTPTATIGIKGTQIAMSERNDQLTVSLASGLIQVQNEDETLDLQPGKMIEGITRQGKFKDKIKPLPYKLVIKPDIAQIELPQKGMTRDIYFNFQLIEVRTNADYHQTGDVYITLPIDKVVFPDKIRLNSRGYARVKALIKPFQQADYKNGQVVITAAMDGEKFINVGSGNSILNYKVPKRSPRSIRIDLDSGKVKR